MDNLEYPWRGKDSFKPLFEKVFNFGNGDSINLNGMNIESSLGNPEERLEFLRRASYERVTRLINFYDRKFDRLLEVLWNLETESFSKLFLGRTFFRKMDFAKKSVINYLRAIEVIKDENLDKMKEATSGYFNGKYWDWRRIKINKKSEEDLEAVLRGEPVTRYYEEKIPLTHIDNHLRRNRIRELAWKKAMEVMGRDLENVKNYLGELMLCEGNFSWFGPGDRRRDLAIKNAVNYLISLGVLKRDEIDVRYQEGLEAFLSGKFYVWCDKQVKNCVEREYVMNI